MKMFTVLKTLIFSLLIMLCLSSCVKSGCTNSFAYNYDPSAAKDDGSCIDLTKDITGLYNGTFEVQNIGTGASQSATEQILVTSVDYSHVVISAVGGGDMPFTKVSLKPGTNGDLLLNVATQVWSGITITPYIIYSADGQPCSGGYVSASRQINILAITDGTDIIGFQGSH